MKEYRRLIFIMVMVILLLRPLIARMTDKSIYRGPWYAVKVPQGWNSRSEDNTIYFTTPDTNILTGNPEAVFSIFSQKSKGALFIEDLFDEVQASLAKSGAIIRKKGEIKIDKQLSKWILFELQDPPAVILTFFIVDDFNRLTRIQFVSHPNDFSKYRPQFEAFKDSLKFKSIF